MKLVVSFLLLLHVVAAVDVEWMQIQPSLESQHIDNIWQAWKDIYAKSYSPREEAYRRSVFVQKLEEVSSHNARYPMEVSYTLGLNHFSDMTHEEYKAYNKLQARANLTRDGATFLPPMNVDQLPATVDWRTKGMVTPVKNQGQCGSCWAFSATGSLEGQHARKTGSLLSLSEQQLVDCSGPSGNNGCDGGLMDNAFRYIMNQPGGLETEQSYPYTAVDGTCVSNPSLEVASVRGYTDLPFGNEEALKTASATVGPISVAIDANHPSFQSYHSGVFNEPLCSSTKLDHGVLVVGYGTQNGQDYWLVKNSWGTSWGQSGYILMARNNNNMCGIATMASYPLV